MTNHLLGKKLFDVYTDFSHVPSANMVWVGFMTYIGTSHQGAIEIFWLHFWGAVVV